MKTSVDTFSVVEILAEYSKATRLGLIALESLYDFNGIDRDRVSTLAESVRKTHSEATGYLVSVVGAAEAACGSDSLRCTNKPSP